MADIAIGVGDSSAVDIEGCIIDNDGNALDPITYAVIPPERLIKVKTGDAIHCFDIDTLFQSMYSAKNKVLINPFNRQPFDKDTEEKVKAYGDSISMFYTIGVPLRIRPTTPLWERGTTVSENRSVPGFVRVGELVVNLLVDAYALGGYQSYRPLLSMDIQYAMGGSFVEGVAAKSIQMKQIVADAWDIKVVSANNGGFVFVQEASIVGNKNFVVALNEYTNEHATGEMDANYYIHHATKSMIREGVLTIGSVQELLDAVKDLTDTYLWQYIIRKGRKLEPVNMVTLNNQEVLLIYRRLVGLSHYLETKEHYIVSIDTLGPLLYIIDLVFTRVRAINKPEIYTPEFNFSMELCYGVNPKLNVVRAYLQDRYEHDVGIGGGSFEFEDYAEFKLRRRPELATINRAPFGTVRRDNIDLLIKLLEDADAKNILIPTLEQLSKRSDFKLLIEHQDIVTWSWLYGPDVFDKVINVIPEDTTNAILKKLKGQLVSLAN